MDRVPLVDLTERGITRATAEDPALVLLAHEDEYARRLWRRVVAEGFGSRVSIVESVEGAPSRLSAVICDACADEDMLGDDAVPAIVTTRPLRIDSGRPRHLHGPSAFEAAQVLSELLTAQVGREFGHALPNVDERPFILVVDDDTAVMTILHRALAWSLRPYVRIERAEGGAVALEVMERSLPDVVHLDDMMPVVDGIDVVRAMSASPRLAGTPVIFHTSYGATNAIESLAPLRPLAVMNTMSSRCSWIRGTAWALSLRGHDMRAEIGLADPDDYFYLAPDAPRSLLFGDS